MDACDHGALRSPPRELGLDQSQFRKPQSAKRRSVFALSTSNLTHMPHCAVGRLQLSIKPTESTVSGDDHPVRVYPTLFVADLAMLSGMNMSSYKVRLIGLSSSPSDV